MPFNVPPAAGKVVGSDGVGFVDIFPPGYLLAADAGGAGTPQNTTAETSVLNAVLSPGLPAFGAVGDAVHLRAWGVCVLGASGTLTLNVYAGGTLGTGGTKIVAGSASGSYATGVTRGWLLDLWLHLLSSTTVSASGLIIPRTANAAGFQSLPGASDFLVPGNDAGVAVAVSALPQVLDIRATMSTATAAQVTCKGATARYFPKNY